MITKEILENELKRICIAEGSVPEVHRSVSSFGMVEGAADTVISAVSDKEILS